MKIESSWRRRRSKATATALALVAGLLFTACSAGQPERETTVPSEPVAGGELVVGLDYETVGWTPGVSAIATAGLNVANAIYDPLMIKADDGSIHPYLAESLEPNEDNSVWTLKLRPEVVFHDGTPLNAEAIKIVWDEYLTGPASTIASVLGEVTSVDIVDELTATYTLAGPNVAFPALLTTPAGWPFSPTAAAENGEEAAANPVGTGPFQFVSWQRDSELVVEKNENYWQDGLPYLDKITFRPIPEGPTRAAALQSGDLDAAQATRPEAITAMERIDGVTMHTFLPDTANGYLYNTANAPLDDVRIRTALLQAIDMDAALEIRGSAGMVDPATQWFSQTSPYYSDAAAEAWPKYDIEAAQELYDDYVNDPGRSDGKAVGEPISVEFMWASEASNKALSEYYQASWNALGAEVSIDLTDTASLVERLISGDFQISGNRVGTAGEADPYYRFGIFFSEGPANFARFMDDRITEQIEVLATTAELGARKAAVEQISLVIADELPYVTVDGSPFAIAAHEDVYGLDEWTMPDGTAGFGIPEGAAMWAYAWTTR